MAFTRTIAWDVDDVLNNLMHDWFVQKWLKDNGKCGLRYEDIAENPPHRLLGVQLETYRCSLDEFRLSALYQQMTPVKEVMEWFIEYGDNFRHIALTAVPLIAASASAQWVFKHFGKWIRTFHFVPSKREGLCLPETDKNKADFLKWIGRVDVFIDDNADNIKGIADNIKTIVFPRPWNNNKASIIRQLGEIGELP